MKYVGMGIFVVALAGCGGGGGGDGGSGGDLSAQSKWLGTNSVQLAQVALSDCSGNNCFSDVKVSVADGGEFSVSWRQLEGTNAASIQLANASVAGGEVYSRVSAPLGSSDPFDRLVAVGPRKFVFINQSQDWSVYARVLSLAGAAGSATVSNAVLLPDTISPLTHFVAGDDGSLIAAVSGKSLPWPVQSLGDGVSLSLVTPQRSEHQSISQQQYFPGSQGPLWAVRGVLPKDLSAESVSLYQLSLADGALVSKQSVIPPDANVLGCSDGVRAASFAANEATMWWSQGANNPQQSCDLYVDGVRVPEVYRRTPTSPLVSGAAGGMAFAVWQEDEPAVIGKATPQRIRWSRRDAASARWTEPAKIDPRGDDGAYTTVDAWAPGPGGSAVVLWVPAVEAGVSYRLDFARLSVYAGGQWTTQVTQLYGIQTASPPSSRALGIGVNGKGQGVAVFRVECEGQSPTCTRLIARRF